MARITVFGRDDCGKCKATRSKVNHVVEKLGVSDRVEIVHYDVTSEEGMAEGAFRDVLEIPTTIIDDGQQDIRRWTAIIPDSEELEDALKAL